MTNEEIFAAVAIKTWNRAIGRLDQLLSSLTDDEFQTEVSPGRNRVYYVVGHLAATHDLMIPLLGLGERLCPELDDIFIANPDRTFPDKFSAAELRKALTEVNAKLTEAISALPAAELLKRHSSISVEEFANEPLRNRLAVLENRTAHATYHTGQIRLVTKP